MEPDGPEKKELKSVTGVEVADKAAPGLPEIRENIKEELDLLKKKLSKETALEELRALKTRRRARFTSPCSGSSTTRRPGAGLWVC